MSGTPRLRVWDLPTRLFHWALALLVVCSVVTAQVGGLWMDWHMRAGYAALALLLFRLLWGVFGSRYARFTQFVRGPSAVLAYLRTLRAGGAAPQAGHNPLGALSVLAMLAALLLQAATGLFANDAIATEGPLAKFVSGSTSDLLTRIHKLNQYVLYALVALHVAAIAFYRLIKREDLLLPMFTGDRTGVAGEPARDDLAMRLRAALLLALAAGAVAYLVTR
ncbi:MAG: cytochrome b/b6 domain-containing protein [Burkholderiaceae bacterium]|nr:cytochrome b/b6 domain-containing protein [Burkholderiaceae bacterium]